MYTWARSDGHISIPQQQYCKPINFRLIYFWPMLKRPKISSGWNFFAARVLYMYSKLCRADWGQCAGLDPEVHWCNHGDITATFAHQLWHAATFKFLALTLEVLWTGAWLLQFFLILQQAEIKLGPKRSFPEMAENLLVYSLIWAGAQERGHSHSFSKMR